MRTVWVVAALMASAGAALAQQAGDLSAGRAYATQNCSQCHSVEPNATVSPNGGAPPFAAVAKAPGMTELALNVFFRSPHPSMPNLIVSATDARNVIAYILSLKR